MRQLPSGTVTLLSRTSRVRRAWVRVPWLAIADELRDRPGRIFGVGILARIAAEQGRHQRAGRLWSAVRDEDASAPLGGRRRHRQTCEDRIRELAGPELDGDRVALTLDDAVALALS
jgi:hypothetical protein